MKLQPFNPRWVAAGLFLILGPSASSGALPFIPGDVYRVEADTSFRPDSADLDSGGGGTSIFPFEEGSYTDFTFLNLVNLHFVGVGGWAREFPNFDFVISATDPDGEGLFYLRQANGDVIFQETVGTPSFFYQTALDPEDGFSTVHSFKFLQDTKRVTLLKGSSGGFLVDETVSDVTRIAWFDVTGNLVKEWATENYRFVTGPIIGAFIDGSALISGEVEPLIQTAGDGSQNRNLTIRIDPKSASKRSASWKERFLASRKFGWETNKDPYTDEVNGLIPFLVLISFGPLTAASEPLASTGPILKGNSTNGASSGLAVAWVDDNLTTARELSFPDLIENDSFRKISVSAGRGNEIVFPARMDDPSGGPSFLVLVRLDLDTGNVLESVRFQLDDEYTFTSLEYRSGQIFGLLFGATDNYLLRCDPLNLAGLEIALVANVSGRVHFNLPSDTTLPLDATWSDIGSSAHFVAAFDDNLDDIFCLDFEPVIPASVESVVLAVDAQGPIAGTPTEVLVEQTDPQWADLLQPNDRPVTLVQPTLVLTRTCEALRLVGEPDGAGHVRVRFPTITGYDYQLRSAGDPSDLQSSGAIVETIPGTGSDIVRLFDKTETERFFAVKAIRTP